MMYGTVRTLAVLTIFGVSACAVDTTSGLPAAQPSGACSVVAVHSDFVSTSVSLLNGDGTLCVDGFVDSGSAALDVVAALSGAASRWRAISRVASGPPTMPPLISPKVANARPSGIAEW